MELGNIVTLGSVIGTVVSVVSTVASFVVQEISKKKVDKVRVRFKDAQDQLRELEVMVSDTKGTPVPSEKIDELIDTISRDLREIREQSIAPPATTDQHSALST